jgi:hemolysin activation/secretion protein
VQPAQSPRRRPRASRPRRRLHRSLCRWWFGALALLFPALAAAQGPLFNIARFVVEGNTLLPGRQVDTVLAPFTGKDRAIADVQRAVRALENEYQREGYVAVLVTVPEQEVRGGEVRLLVSEARIAQVRVQGNVFFDEANIRRSLPALKEGTSPNTRKLAESAQLANENPAKHVAISLRAMDLQNVEATIRVTDEDPGKFSVFGDNTGTPDTGRRRIGVGYQNANMFDRDQVLNAQVITSPDSTDDVLISGIGYRVPIYRWRGVFDAVLGYSNVDSGTVQGLFAVSGEGTIFGLRYTQHLRRFGTYEQRLQLAWDRREFRNDVTFEGSESLVPDVNVQPLSLTYRGRFNTLGTEVGFYVSAARNIPGSGDASQEAFTATRLGADASYSILRAGGAYSQALPRHFLFRAVFNAQYTNDLLVPGEQFGMGGVYSVRGFFEREAINDMGAQGSVEVYTPDFAKRFSDRWSMRALVFADAASGSDNEPARGPDNELSSLGFGLQVAQGKQLALRLDWAYVTQGAGTRPTGSDRLHFAAAYVF